jgi:hypothetical protein
MAGPARTSVVHRPSGMVFGWLSFISGRHLNIVAAALLAVVVAGARRLLLRASLIRAWAHSDDRRFGRLGWGWRGRTRCLARCQARPRRWSGLMGRSGPRGRSRRSRLRRSRLGRVSGRRRRLRGSRSGRRRRRGPVRRLWRDRWPRRRRRERRGTRRSSLIGPGRRARRQTAWHTDRWRRRPGRRSGRLWGQRIRRRSSALWSSGRRDVGLRPGDLRRDRDFAGEGRRGALVRRQAEARRCRRGRLPRRRRREERDGRPAVGEHQR